MKPLPDQEYLLECLLYDPLAGTLKWKERPERHFGTARGHRTYNSMWAGKSAGYINTHGYHYIFLDQTEYAAHRLMWKMIHGDIPEHYEIDHINGDTTDNRIENLRCGTKSQNQMNRGAPKNNTSGYKGVRRDGDRFDAFIGKDGKTHFVGSFKTINEAVNARVQKERELFGEFYHPRDQVGQLE